MTNRVFRSRVSWVAGREQGVALITVMVMFALFVGLAAYLADAQQRALLRTARLVESSQASWVGASVEALAVHGLAVDRSRDSNNKSPRDHPKEEWHRVLASVPVGRSAVSAQLQDLSGRFNINSLVGTNGEEQQRRFVRLLAALNIPGDAGEPSPETLTARIVDWLDDDEEPRPGGAESSVYALQDPPYLPANQPMVHLSELRLIEGFQTAWMAILEPHVAALPDVNSKENVNFSTREVLSSVNGLDGATIVNERPDDGYDSVQEAINAKGESVDENDDESVESEDELSEDAPTREDGPDLSLFDVKSQFFLMKAKIEQDGRADHIEMVLYRPLDEKEPVEVVYRMRVRPFIMTRSEE